MKKQRKTPQLTQLFLYKQGLRIEPDEMFLNKFLEIYNGLMTKSKSEFRNTKTIDENTAKFFIVCMCEYIIHSLDFGFDIWFKRVMVFIQKMSDYVLNSPMRKSGIQENVRKITFRPISSLRLKIRSKINENNVLYQEFTKNKAERYQSIKQYYKD
mgnify:CR=1 FL=1